MRQTHDSNEAPLSYLLLKGRAELCTDLQWRNRLLRTLEELFDPIYPAVIALLEGLPKGLRYPKRERTDGGE